MQDKHSRKGLQEMVQRRKKYLKYLRRTDWDSYYIVLSKLGLRDVPEYRAPDYKSKSSTKTKKQEKEQRKNEAIVFNSRFSSLCFEFRDHKLRDRIAAQAPDRSVHAGTVVNFPHSPFCENHFF